jgi:hypothetical protein
MASRNGGTDSSGSRAASQDILYPLPYTRLGVQITARLAKPLLLSHRRHGVAGTRAEVAGDDCCHPRPLDAGSDLGKIADNSCWLALRNGAPLLALFWLAARRRQPARLWGAPRAPHAQTGPLMAALSAGSIPVCSGRVARMSQAAAAAARGGLDQPCGERVSVRACSSALRTSALTFASGFSW